MELKIPQNTIEPFYNALCSNAVHFFAMNHGLEDDRLRLKDLAVDAIWGDENLIIMVEENDLKVISQLLAQYRSAQEDDAFHLRQIQSRVEDQLSLLSDEIDWYESRAELKEDMVFRCQDESLVKLDRRVPGDGTKWYVADWAGYWCFEDSTIEPGDLVEQVGDPAAEPEEDQPSP